MHQKSSIDKALKNPEKFLERLRAKQDIIGDLSQPEIKIIANILREIRNTGNSNILTQLRELDYIRTPPTITEFLDSPYYLGSVCKANEEEDYDGMYPYWRKVLCEDIFSKKSVINQLILGGSIGSGKTFTGVVATLFKLAHCMCLRNPTLYYGLAKGTSITCSIFSVTKDQVKRGAFQDMLSFMRLSPFFIENTLDNIEDQKFTSLTVRLSNNLQIEAGSKTHQAIGRNTLYSIVDEVNYRLEADAATAAKKLVTAIDRRLKSRFKRGDVNPGFLTIISSANQESDFLVDYIRQQKKVITTRVLEPPQWEVHGGVKYTLDGTTFDVDIGDSIRMPKILDADEDIPDGARILKVPTLFKPDFEANLLDAIKDIGGVSTGAVTKLFGHLAPVLDALSDSIKNGFTVDTIPLSAGTEVVLKDYFDISNYFAVRGNAIAPRRHPEAPRFIHLDMSTGAQDALSICGVHPCSTVNIEKLSSLTARKEYTLKPLWEVDFLLRVTRHRGSKDIIDLGKIREFIYWLWVCNVKIKTVSADLLHLSSETLSILTQLGITTKYLSVDRTKEPYRTLRQVFGERRIQMFPHDYTLLELINLEDGVKKVDHPEEFSVTWKFDNGSTPPKKGSKDMADGLCGSIFCGEQAEESYVMPHQDDLIERMESIRLMNPGVADVQNSREAPKDKTPIM